MAEDTHRKEMAQAEGEASRKLYEQGVMHASAQEAFKREAANNHADFANLMNAKQEADRHAVQAAFAEMQQRKEEDIGRLLAVHTQLHKKHSAKLNRSESQTSPMPIVTEFKALPRNSGDHLLDHLRRVRRNSSTWLPHGEPSRVHIRPLDQPTMRL